jgi:hypothetical protein
LVVPNDQLLNRFSLPLGGRTAGIAPILRLGADPSQKQPLGLEIMGIQAQAQHRQIHQLEVQLQQTQIYLQLPPQTLQTHHQLQLHFLQL